jgi:hypothetical protein
MGGAGGAGGSVGKAGTITISTQGGVIDLTTGGSSGIFTVSANSDTSGNGSGQGGIGGVGGASTGSKGSAGVGGTGGNGGKQSGGGNIVISTASTSAGQASVDLLSVNASTSTSSSGNGAKGVTVAIRLERLKLVARVAPAEMVELALLVEA